MVKFWYLLLKINLLSNPELYSRFQIQVGLIINIAKSHKK